MNFVDIHTHKPSSNLAIIDLTQDNTSYKKGGVFSLGIHPWSAETADFDHLKSLLLNLDKKIPFIGECGLDKNYKASYDKQIYIFRLQLKLAETLGKGVIIHCVKSYEEIYKILNDYTIPVVIFHDFYSSFEIAQKFINRGYFLSMGRSLFRKSSKSRSILLQLGIDNIFFETDDSEYSIVDIYSEVSNILSIPLDQIKNSVYKRFQHILKRVEE